MYSDIELPLKISPKIGDYKLEKIYNNIKIINTNNALILDK